VKFRVTRHWLELANQRLETTQQFLWLDSAKPWLWLGLWLEKYFRWLWFEGLV